LYEICNTSINLDNFAVDGDSMLEMEQLLCKGFSGVQRTSQKRSTKMRFGKLSLAAVAAASLVSAPVMAQSLSPAAKAVGASKVKRVGANTAEESKLGGGSGVIVAVIAAVAVIGGIIIAAGNDDDAPTSP
jgi:hypothetical protein